MDLKKDRNSFLSGENDLDIDSEIQGEYYLPGTAKYTPTKEIIIRQVESAKIENPIILEEKHKSFDNYFEKEDLQEEKRSTGNEEIKETVEKINSSKEGEESGTYNPAKQEKTSDQINKEEKSGNRKYIIIIIILILILLTKCLG